VRRNAATALLIGAVTFIAGFATHLLYQRWNQPLTGSPESAALVQSAPSPNSETPHEYRVSYVPLPLTAAAKEQNLDLPVIVARDVEKLRDLTGREARVRGRIFRVGHSAKSNTYFLNFGPSREALTAVIFASAVELFEKNKLAPRNFENKEVELTGQIKDHPQYGLEIVLESPKQIKILN